MLYFLSDSRFTMVGEGFFAYSKVIRNPSALFSGKHPDQARVEFGWQYFLLYLYALIIVENYFI